MIAGASSEGQEGAPFARVLPPRSRRGQRDVDIAAALDGGDNRVSHRAGTQSLMERLAMTRFIALGAILLTLTRLRLNASEAPTAGGQDVQRPAEAVAR